MAETKKYLDQEGIAHLWSKINMQDYPNNELLIGVIEAIDETKANKEDVALIETEVNTKINDLSDVVAYIDATDNENIEDSVTSGGVSSWNDLKDKPFYDEIVEILPETQMVYYEDAGVFGVEFAHTFIEGNTYIVNWNGTEYTCVAFAYDEDGDGVTDAVVVGNLAVFGGENNGAPFLLATKEGMLAAMALDGSTEVTLSIVLRNLQTLDTKYIPTIPEEKLPTIQMFDLVEKGLTNPAGAGFENVVTVTVGDYANKIISSAARGPVIFRLPIGALNEQHQMKTATKFGVDSDGNFLSAIFSWTTFGYVTEPNMLTGDVYIRTYTLSIGSSQINFYYIDYNVVGAD